MAIQILKDYCLSDMTARYLTDENKKQVGLVLLPSHMPAEYGGKNESIDSLVQIKITGDCYNEAYAMGNSMRNGETVRKLEYQRQETEQRDGTLIIRTILEAPGEYQVVHHLKWRQQEPYVKMFCTVENLGTELFQVEMFESFSLSSISPYLEGEGENQMSLHRIRSVWSQEGRLETIPLEDLQLEPAWDPHAVRCEKFGQAGSMPVNKFFPFAAVEDKKNHVFWGVQIAHPSSWQIELYRKDDALAISGGIADRDFGHWRKNIIPGQCFTTPEAIVTTVQSESLDILTGRLVEAAREGIEKAPQTEQDLPIIFNEYCTTWGNPSHENICQILNCIKDKGFGYFVIDCGWYKKEGIPWDVSMGDYEPSEFLFPEGLEKTVEKIKQAGMVPGIWFEIEAVGSKSQAWNKEDHLLHKDGKVLTSYFRRFWNMKDPWVEDYLTQKVIGMLNHYGFGYMKIDYNETIGIGCDGAESLGEGLRQNIAASTSFFEKVKREVPGVVLENCASGGHRLEPSLMRQMSMASFSDAHECLEIPVIAANLHRVIHPAQSQIWAVIRQTDSRQRIVYSLASTFLGRMCISGDVINLDKEQWEVIDAGMAFYRKLVPVIRQGQSYHFGTKIMSARHPQGWQALLRVGKNGQAYLVLHTFDIADLPEMIQIILPKECPQKVAAVYSEETEEIEIKNNCLYYQVKQSWKALTLLLQNDIV